MRHFGRFQSLLYMDNSPFSLHYFTLSQLLEAENTIENLSMLDHASRRSKQLQRTLGSFRGPCPSVTQAWRAADMGFGTPTLKKGLDHHAPRKYMYSVEVLDNCMIKFRNK